MSEIKVGKLFFNFINMGHPEVQDQDEKAFTDGKRPLTEDDLDPMNVVSRIPLEKRALFTEIFDIKPNQRPMQKGEKEK